MTLTPKLHDVPRESLKLLMLLALWPHYWGALSEAAMTVFLCEQTQYWKTGFILLMKV